MKRNRIVWLGRFGIVCCTVASMARADIGFVDTARARVHVAYRAGSQVILRHCRPPVAPPVSRRCQSDLDEVKQDLSDLLKKLPYETGAFERSASGLALLEKFLTDAEAEATKGNQEATKAVERLRRQREGLRKAIAFEGSLDESASSTIYEYNSDYAWLLSLLGGGTSNPYARRKIGDSVTYRSSVVLGVGTVASAGVGFESYTTTTVSAKFSNSIELSHVTRTKDGKETESKSTMDLTAPYPVSPKSNDEVKIEKVGHANERLTFLGNSYVFDRIEYRYSGKTKEGKVLTGTSKIWISPEFPFGLAKTEAHFQIENSKNSWTMEAVKAVLDGKTLGN